MKLATACEGELSMQLRLAVRQATSRFPLSLLLVDDNTERHDEKNLLVSSSSSSSSSSAVLMHSLTHSLTHAAKREPVVTYVS